MENQKIIIFSLLLLGIAVFVSCNDNLLEVKGRTNINDAKFERAKISLITLEKENYQLLTGQFQAKWKNLSAEISPINPSIWLYRNGQEYTKIEDINPNMLEGVITVNLAKYNFQHMDLCQLCFVQNANGKKWIDSLQSSIFLYDSLKTPVLSQLTANSITKNSMKLLFKIIKKGPQTITELGICYNTVGTPVESENKYTFSSPFTDGQILETTVKSLSADKLYYFRLFAKNQNGITYGNPQTFQTAPPTKPVINTPQVSNIAGSSVDITASISDDGGGSITERGFIYSKLGNPSISDNKTVVSGTGGVFSTKITGLEPLVKYYFAAYAVNASGTTISNVINATTTFPDKNCQISQKTTGTYYTIQIPSKPYFKAGENITVTMYSPTYKFGQASTIRLYDGDNQLSSFGNWLVFTNNSRDLTLPSTLPASNCYNIQVMDNAGSVYVTSKFTVIP